MHMAKMCIITIKMCIITIKKCIITIKNIKTFLRSYNIPDHKSWVFQSKNDPKHTSKRTEKWMETKNCRVLKWPAMSSDLNPTEHRCLRGILELLLGEGALRR